MRRSVAWLLLLAAAVAGCGGGTIEGSGTIRDEVRPVTPFERIEVQQGLSVQITVDSGAAASVIVRYDDNLVGSIITEVSGDTLEIRLERAVSPGGGQRYVEVITPRLNRLEASEGARVVGVGRAAALQVVASGGASVDLGSLVANEVEVDISGGANTTVNASGVVKGDASGGARLLVVGDPSAVDVATSGGASIAGE